MKKENTEVLLKWIEDIIAAVDLESLFDVILRSATSLTDSEGASLLLLDERFNELYFAAATGDVSEKLLSLRVPYGQGIAGKVVETGEPMIVDKGEIKSKYYQEIDKQTGFTTQSILAIPLKIDNRTIGVLEVVNKKTGSYTQKDAEIIERLSVYATRAIIEKKEKERLEEGWRSFREIEEIQWRPVWGSKKFEEILKLAEQVASTDVTVLITGESGVGKEVVARYIHSKSPRKHGPFVAINCAGIPDNLLESELFGYEKGAFTGATKSKKGKFELADGGSLLLDEVGDLSPALQQKILRFVEYKSFERLGGIKTIKVDTRLICATNRNLEDLVKEEKFREDLYYRLNVFPIHIPPLRERKEDIIPLALHFLGIAGREMKKPVSKLSPEAEDKLLAYDWPGNARELRNVIERAVILAKDEVIKPEEIIIPRKLRDEGKIKPLEDAIRDFKRDYILRVLSKTKTQKEAAKLLGIQHTYLSRLIKELGIR